MPYFKLFFICVIDIEEQPLLPLQINLYHNCVWKNQLQLAHFVNS